MFAMICVLFYYQNDLYVKQKQQDVIQELRWRSQMEAFRLYSDVINKQSNVIIDLAKYRNRWRTS